MDVRVLDLDGSVASQPGLPTNSSLVPCVCPGPGIRLACSFRRFRRFEYCAGPDACPRKRRWSALYGSGDFHHVSPCARARLREPFNLVVIDNHPDWMCAIPFLHCGTWLHHAARLPQVRHVFHLGGDVDFDNAYRGLAPWPLLRSNRLRVYPARRRFGAGGPLLPTSRCAPSPTRRSRASVYGACWSRSVRNSRSCRSISRWTRTSWWPPIRWSTGIQAT